MLELPPRAHFGRSLKSYATVRRTKDELRDGGQYGAAGSVVPPDWSYTELELGRFSPSPDGM